MSQDDTLHFLVKWNQSEINHCKKVLHFCSAKNKTLNLWLPLFFPDAVTVAGMQGQIIYHINEKENGECKAESKGIPNSLSKKGYVLGIYCCDKHHEHKAGLGEKGLLSLYFHIAFHHCGKSVST